MKVYILVEDFDSDYSKIHGIFSSEALVRKAKIELPETARYNSYWEEREIDEFKVPLE